MTPALLLAFALVSASPATTANRVPTPRDATYYAVQDLNKIGNPDDPQFIRYLWWPTPSKTSWGETAFTLNAVVSGQSELYRPVPLYGGALVRVDIRNLASDANHLAKIRDDWEDMAAVNWTFNTLRTRSAQVVTSQKKVKVPWYTHSDGKRYQFKWVQTFDTQVVRFQEPALHVGLENYMLLVARTGSRNPIMRADQFQQIAWSTRNGGRYYEWLGIEDSGGGRTGFQKFADRFGVDLEDLNNQNRIGITESGVTFKPRQAYFLVGNKGRPSAGYSLWAATFDLDDSELEADEDPIRNLANFRFAASEVFATRRNGMLAYALFNAAGARQASVPDSIAKDSTAHLKNGGILEAGISCLRCHASHDGWKPAPNDVKHMMEHGLNIFDDTSAKSNDLLKNLETIKGQYLGDMTEPLRIARNFHEFHTFKLTGMHEQQVAIAISDSINRYLYDSITPMVAMRELGYSFESDQIAAVNFDKIIPVLPVSSTGIRPEDVNIGMLRSWRDYHPTKLTRSQWERLYSDAMLRVITKQALDAGLPAPSYPKGVLKNEHDVKD
jgi:hypothetical protein